MAIAENLIHGRWDEARESNKKELRATSVVAIEIESASAKTRNGPPVDDDEDYELPIWAGIVPIKTSVSLSGNRFTIAIRNISSGVASKVDVKLLSKEE